MVYFKEEVFDENSRNLFDEDCKLTRVARSVAKKSKKRSKKPKVVSKWSDNEVFKLIACVNQHPALWDTRDSQYHNKHERAKLWDEISENELSKFESAELLAKWSNIRIQFRSYTSKKLKSSQAAPPPINWKFYTAMQFVGHAECEQISSRKSNLNIEKGNTSVGNIPVSCISPVRRISRKRRLSMSTVAPTSSTTSHSAATIVTESVKAAVKSFNQSKQQAQHSDEFEAFGKFLASELRSLDNIAIARRIKYKLNRYFLDVVDEETCKTGK